MSGQPPAMGRKLWVPITRSQASDATGGGAAPVRGTAQPLAAEGGASGAPQRNRTTRSRTAIGRIAPEGGEDLDRPEADPVPSPQPRARRMRWMREENLDLLRAYYRATNLEQQRTGYRMRLFEAWTILRPHSERSAQQLSDQVRSIIRRNVVSRAEIEQLKTEIRNEQEQESHPEEDRIPANVTQHRRSRLSILPTPEPEALREQINDVFGEINAQYSGIEMPLRPRIPKIKYNQITKTVVQNVDIYIARHLAESRSLEKTCHLIYCAAATVCKITNLPMGKTKAMNPPTTDKSPPWKIRLENKITGLRKQIGVINTYLTNSSPSRKTRKSLMKIVQLQHLENHSRNCLNICMDNLKQKIAALGCRLRRYNESEKRKQQNKQFSQNAKLFFRKLGEKHVVEGNEVVEANRMTEFWSELWGTEKEHEEAYWIQDEEKRVEELPQMQPVQVTREKVKEVVQSLGNWKAPGIDNIQAYWWKNFASVHEILATQFAEALQNPEIIPEFFTAGITYMLPKNQNTKEPENYRPITCLPVVYKIFTSVLEKAVSDHLRTHDVLAKEQNGSRKGTRGSTEWLIIDSIVGKQASKKKRNISVAWIDYKKAFDSVPHSWLLRILEIYKIYPSITRTIKYLMGTWRTCLSVHSSTRSYTTSPIDIRRGIF